MSTNQNTKRNQKNTKMGPNLNQAASLNTSPKNIRLVSDHLLFPGNTIINIDRVREAGAMLIALAEERDANSAAISRIKAERDRLRAALLECAGDLEDELMARYGTPPHPAEGRRFERDMETVTMARRLANG